MAKACRWCSWAGFANLQKAKPLKCHMQARVGANRRKGRESKSRKDLKAMNLSQAK